jgi:hypothetical protein
VGEVQGDGVSQGRVFAGGKCKLGRVGVGGWVCADKGQEWHVCLHRLGGGQAKKEVRHE